MVAGVPRSASINARSGLGLGRHFIFEAGRGGRNRAEGLFKRRLFRSHGLGRTCGPGPLLLPGSRAGRCCTVQLPVGLRHRRTAKRTAAPLDGFQAQALPEFPFFLGVGLPSLRTRSGQEHRFIGAYACRAGPGVVSLLLLPRPQRPIRRRPPGLRSKGLRLDLRRHSLGETPPRLLIRFRGRSKLGF